MTRNNLDNNSNVNMDEGLIGNEKIEEAIKILQAEPSEEMLAHTLTIIRRRMKEAGQFIIAVDAPKEAGRINIQSVKTEDGRLWWMAFTGFEEELKGADSIKSTFLTDIDKMFKEALNVDGIEAIIINPWNRTIMLNKQLIKIILGDGA